MLLLKVVTGIFPTSCTHTDKWVQTNKMGGSRKYPYHTTDGLSEFRGQGGGGSLNWKSEGMGGYLRLEFRRHAGFLDLGFPQETVKSVFLEKANFMDF